MLSSIALSILLAVIVAGCALVRYCGRRGRDPWQLLRDLGPVSGQWLADRRRSG
jgi:hypothetical protein